MPCKSCQSENQRSFNGELGIHHPGREITGKQHCQTPRVIAREEAGDEAGHTLTLEKKKGVACEITLRRDRHRGCERRWVEDTVVR